MLVLQRGMSFAEIARLFTGERFAPEPPTGEERARIEGADLKQAPAHVAGDFPEWIEPSLRAVFGDDLVPEIAGPHGPCAPRPAGERAEG